MSKPVETEAPVTFRETQEHLDELEEIPPVVSPTAADFHPQEEPTKK